MDQPIDPVSPTPEALNLKQVARLLDVHYMTVYRYVRHGRLPAHREGTGWLVERAAAAAIRAGGAATAPGTAVDWAGRLAGRLRLGDEVGAWTVVRDAQAAGHDVVRIHLDVVAAAVARVGAEPGSDPGAERDAAVDQRIAVATASRLVGRLGGACARGGRKRGRVLLATPPGEHHGLPLAIIANLIRTGGYEVVEVGTDASVDLVLAAVERVDDLVAVGLSVTVAERFDATVEVIRAVRSARPDLHVLVGGQAVRNRTVAELAGATAWSAGPDLVARLDALVRDPSGARTPVRSS